MKVQVDSSCNNNYSPTSTYETRIDNKTNWCEK